MNKALRSVFVLAAAATPLAAAVPATAATAGTPTAVDAASSEVATGASTAGSNGQAAEASPLLPPGSCRSVTRRDDPPVVRGWGSVRICRSANGGRLDINGSTYDALADGLCAQLYGQYNTGAWWYGPRTCPAGNTEYFHRYKDGAVDSTVYLRFN